MVNKNSVYDGEVLGFTVGRILKNVVQVLTVEFKTQEDAEKWCESMNEPNKVFVYFPIKLTSLTNTYVPEPSYD